MNTRSTMKWLRLGVPLAALILSGTGCATRAPRGAVKLSAAAAPTGEGVRWPADYRPEDATFFVHNVIEIAAPPELVWEELMAAEAWPNWYAGASGVKVSGGDGPGRLGPRARIEWRTMGLDFVSEVKEFEPPTRLSWESRKSTIRGYHAWLILPTAGGGCRVITDESQHGFLAVMQGVFIPKKLHRLHDVWLAELKRRAEARAGATP